MKTIFPSTKDELISEIDFSSSKSHFEKPRTNGSMNKLQPEDQPVHDWYRFVLSFPPHLVNSYIKKFALSENQTVLDPFCGTGTTLIEAKRHGMNSIGIEANPMAHFASEVKLDWEISPNGLLEHALDVAEIAKNKLASDGIADDPFFQSQPNKKLALKMLAPEKNKLLLKDSISPLPLHKTLVLLEALERIRCERYSRHEFLAMAKTLVFSISNLRFGPEVGIGKPKTDVPVIAAWLHEIKKMANDLRLLQDTPTAPAKVYLADSRQLSELLKPASIDAVITSPPYPNEKDYTRTTRLESVLLGFIKNHAELQALKRNLVRSNTRTVYKNDTDDEWVAGYPEIQRIAAAIEQRRLELGKTSGFEKLYARVTRLYFGGMSRHLAELREKLKPGAHLAYVVGDQASYLRVMIRTGQLLADIAKSLGYNVVSIDLFRTRLATATKEQLREEVVILRWMGK